MAALGCYRRGLHTGRAAAHHQHPPTGRRSPSLGVGELTAALGVLDARDGHSHVHVPDARLIAADAGPDLLETPLARLVGHLRIADQRPRHATQIRLPCRQDPFGTDRADRPPRSDHWFAHDPTHNSGMRSHLGVLDLHGRHDVNRAAQRRGGSCHDAEIVDLPAASSADRSSTTSSVRSPSGLSSSAEIRSPMTMSPTRARTAAITSRTNRRRFSRLPRTRRRAGSPVH